MKITRQISHTPLTKMYFALKNSINKRAETLHPYGAKIQGTCLSLTTKQSVCVCVFVCGRPPSGFDPSRRAKSIWESYDLASGNAQGVGGSQRIAHWLMSHTSGILTSPADWRPRIPSLITGGGLLAIVHEIYLSCINMLVIIWLPWYFCE